MLGSLDVRRKDSVAPKVIPMTKVEQDAVQLGNFAPCVVRELYCSTFRLVHGPDTSY